VTSPNLNSIRKTPGPLLPNPPLVGAIISKAICILPSIDGESSTEANRMHTALFNPKWVWGFLANDFAIGLDG